MSLVRHLAHAMPALRGRLEADVPLASLTWFKTGGPAEALFEPADEADLAYFLSCCESSIPILTIGSGSNLLIRDGGVDGIVVRLGKAFAAVSVEGHDIVAGAATPDVKLASAAAQAGLAGLAFLRGIPGSVGGALRMNGGAYGAEIKDVLVEARGVARDGTIATYARDAMGFAYRHCGIAEDVIFTQARLRGTPGDPATIRTEMAEITAARAATQPVNTRTGGSTFKNPREGLGARRQGRLPRPRARRRPGLGPPHQLPHQSRRRHRRRPRGPRRSRPRPRARDEWHRARMGNRPRREARTVTIPRASFPALQGRGTTRSLAEKAAAPRSPTRASGEQYRRRECRDPFIPPLGIQDVARIEPHGANDPWFQPRVSREVPPAYAWDIVRRAVHLDRAFGGRRVDIEHGFADRMLSPKGFAVHRRAAQRLPGSNLRQGHRAPRAAGTSGGSARRAHGTTLPNAIPSIMLRMVPLPRFAEEDVPFRQRKAR